MCIIRFMELRIHVIQDGVLILVKFQVHVIIWVKFRVEKKFYIGQFTVVELSNILSHHILSTSCADAFMAHECLVVLCKRGYSYRSHD